MATPVAFLDYWSRRQETGSDVEKPSSFDFNRGFPASGRFAEGGPGESRPGNPTSIARSCSASAKGTPQGPSRADMVSDRSPAGSSGGQPGILASADVSNVTGEAGTPWGTRSKSSSLEPLGDGQDAGQGSTASALGSLSLDAIMQLAQQASMQQASTAGRGHQGNFTQQAPQQQHQQLQQQQLLQQQQQQQQHHHHHHHHHQQQQQLQPPLQVQHRSDQGIPGLGPQTPALLRQIQELSGLLAEDDATAATRVGPSHAPPVPPGRSQPVNAGRQAANDAEQQSLDLICSLLPFLTAVIAGGGGGPNQAHPPPQAQPPALGSGGVGFSQAAQGSSNHGLAGGQGMSLAGFAQGQGQPGGGGMQSPLDVLISALSAAAVPPTNPAPQPASAAQTGLPSMPSFGLPSLPSFTFQPGRRSSPALTPPMGSSPSVPPGGRPFNQGMRGLSQGEDRIGSFLTGQGGQVSAQQHGIPLAPTLHTARQGQADVRGFGVGTGGGGSEGGSGNSGGLASLGSSSFDLLKRELERLLVEQQQILRHQQQQQQQGGVRRQGSSSAMSGGLAHQLQNMQRQGPGGRQGTQQGGGLQQLQGRGQAMSWQASRQQASSLVSSSEDEEASQAQPLTPGSSACSPRDELALSTFSSSVGSHGIAGGPLKPAALHLPSQQQLDDSKGLQQHQAQGRTGGVVAGSGAATARPGHGGGGTNWAPWAAAFRASGREPPSLNPSALQAVGAGPMEVVGSGCGEGPKSCLSSPLESSTAEHEGGSLSQLHTTLAEVKPAARQQGGRMNPPLTQRSLPPPSRAQLGQHVQQQHQQLPAFTASGVSPASQSTLQMPPSPVASSAPISPTTPSTRTPGVLDDGYSWRKYGQKPAKGAHFPRSYYRCAVWDCPARKTVELAEDGESTEIVYKEEHNHPQSVRTGPRLGVAAAGRAGRQGAERVVVTEDMVGALEQELHGGREGAGLKSPAVGSGSDRSWETDAVEDGEGTKLLLKPSPKFQKGGEGGASGIPGVRVTPLVVSESVDGMDGTSPEGRSPWDIAVPEGDELTPTPGSTGVLGSPGRKRKLGNREAGEEGGSRAAGAAGPSGPGASPRVSPNQASSSCVTGLPVKSSVKVEAAKDELDDGYKWRKYGEKAIKHSPYKRNYYRCSKDGCTVKRVIERLQEDPRFLLVTYEGEHNHARPIVARIVHSQGQIRVQGLVTSSSPASQGPVASTSPSSASPVALPAAGLVPGGSNRGASAAASAPAAAAAAAVAVAAAAASGHVSQEPGSGGSAGVGGGAAGAAIPNAASLDMGDVEVSFLKEIEQKMDEYLPPLA